MLSIVIPSKNEIFLKKTVVDVLDKATGDVEVFPVLDGYDIPDEEVVKDPRVTYIRFEPTRHSKKRQAINRMVEISKGEYVMTLDAHCMMDRGFDEVLTGDCGDEMLMVPRRHRLDAENWALQDQVDSRPPIDYEYIMYPPKFDPVAFHGFKWDKRTLERWDIPIDDIITCQGSCWVMKKTWFNKCGFMDLKYQGWGQEAEEVCFTTWANGGTCKVNKNTWYAHLHKGPKYGRMYFLDKWETRKSLAYAWERWHKDPKFHELVEKFMPMPGWPKNWKEELCRH